MKNLIGNIIIELNLLKIDQGALKLLLSQNSKMVYQKINVYLEGHLYLGLESSKIIRGPF